MENNRQHECHARSTDRCLTRDPRRRRRGVCNSPRTRSFLELKHTRDVSINFKHWEALLRRETSRVHKRCSSSATGETSSALRRERRTHVDDSLLDHVCSKDSSANALHDTRIAPSRYVVEGYRFNDESTHLGTVGESWRRQSSSPRYLLSWEALWISGEMVWKMEGRRFG